MFLKIDLEGSATSVTGIGWLSLGSRIIDDFLSFYFLVISIFSVEDVYGTAVCWYCIKFSSG